MRDVTAFYPQDEDLVLAWRAFDMRYGDPILGCALKRELLETMYISPSIAVDIRRIHETSGTLPLMALLIKP